MKYYKVVDCNLNSISSNYYWFQYGYKVKYKIDEWVYPQVKNTKLFVFDNLQDAQNFAYGLARVYECEVKNPSKFEIDNVGSQYLSFDSFWSSINKIRSRKKKVRHKFDYFKGKIPKGTVFVTAVKLLKKVN